MTAQFIASLPQKMVNVGNSHIYDMEKLYARLLVVSQHIYIHLSDMLLRTAGKLCSVHICICGKGVQAHSFHCTVCIKWIHKRCSGIHGDLSRVADGFRCK